MGYLTNNLISFSFDPLSVFFLTVIGLVSLPSAVYSIGYLAGHYPARKIFYGWVLFIAFVISMILVTTASNALFFIIVWEVMSLVSYFLVIFDSEKEKAIRAGMIYIVMTHIGTAFIIGAVLIMYKYAGSFDFYSIKAACILMPDKIRSVVFLFLLIGFGTKAGIVPLHIWLPYAHPQAPSHISAMMSGVMIKTAVYGLIRFALIILGINTPWCGALVLVIASISALVGVLYALMEHDLKKLLAYSSIENMGIILLGVGAGMVFMRLNMMSLAVFALAAGLYHLINHAIFKGLLFLCAGSIYKATGKRDMEKLGGLIKVMPWTSAAFLTGSMAISALPPLNGFVSEWLTLQTFFMGILNGSIGIKIFFGILAAILALTGALVAACFVRAFGITFLAMPRSKNASAAKEVSLSMKLAMAFLTVMTIVFGLCAPVIMRIITGVSASVMGLDSRVFNSTLNNFVLSPKESSGTYLSTFIVAAGLLLFAVVISCAVYAVSGKRKTSVNKTWDCGYYRLDSRTEYTATAFSKPFRIAFDFFLLPYRKTEKIRESFYHISSFKYETHTTSVFKRYIYKPAVELVLKAATVLKKIQPGSIHLYLLYIFITIITLIVFMNRF